MKQKFNLPKFPCVEIIEKENGSFDIIYDKKHTIHSEMGTYGRTYKFGDKKIHVKDLKNDEEFNQARYILFCIKKEAAFLAKYFSVGERND